MSVTSAVEHTCTNCGTAFDPPTGQPGYCSRTCYFQKRGQGVIDQVEHNSRFCDTCYGQVRDIEPAPTSVTCADGWQYPTPLTTIGIDVFSETPRIEGTRVSCSCGAVDPDAGPIAELQQIHDRRAKVNLYLALSWLADREAIDAAPDLGRYGEALRERPYDAAYAAGRAIYGDDADE